MKHNHPSKNPDSNPNNNNMKNPTFCKLIIKSVYSLLIVLFLFFTIKIFYSSQSLQSFSLSSSLCTPSQSSIDTSIKASSFPSVPSPQQIPQTELDHIVFGLGGASKHWHQRKDYIKFWWKPNKTQGYIFLDKEIFIPESEVLYYPQLRISSPTSRFNYTNKRGSRSGLRMTRIVSEMVRMRDELDLNNVRWFVMGDDDTVFFTENLVRMLRKYDHNDMYYIGCSSETHVQNINDFSYGMAYGGGGFAISVKLALKLERMQDRCMERYPGLYGSDDRIQACLAELGVPLTKEPGFHQFDIFGNVFGLLSSHPVSPILSIHHLDVVEPIFPIFSRAKALNRLKEPMNLDSASLMQQSICYDLSRNWSISVSWGFAIQIYRGIIAPKELEKPPRTFHHWHKRDDPLGFAMTTRPFSQHPCQKPFVYYYSNVALDDRKAVTISYYNEYKLPHPWCWWETPDPSQTVHRIEVYKKPNPHRWDKAPRRNCCRVLPSDSKMKKGIMVLDIGECGEDEVIEPL